jgi:hypothetical protein
MSMLAIVVDNAVPKIGHAILGEPGNIADHSTAKGMSMHIPR